MRPFTFHSAKSSEEALNMATARSAYLAGGTNQVDLMKKHIAEPNSVIQLHDFSNKDIQNDRKGIYLSAASTNSTIADHPDILRRYPLVSKAILAGASPQIRNMATTGGNLLQRTRCPYFYDLTLPCNKRKANSGCGALKGEQRMSAIVGYSSQCVAVHPSDFCVALAALDAMVHFTSTDGTTQSIPMTNFHRLPGDTPNLDTNLPKNALITSVFIPKNPFGNNVAYVKIRERDSYAFALVSAAVALEIKRGKIKSARIASGGVAHKPWRWVESEAFLKNKATTEENFTRAASLASNSTTPLPNNTFKKRLLEGAITTALLQASNTNLEN